MSRSMLSQNLIEQQLAQIDLLLAMFPDEDAISLSETASTSLNTWRSMKNNAVQLPPNTPASVSLLLNLGLDLGLDPREGTVNRTIQLDIRVPFFACNDDQHDADEPPYPAVRLVQPSWMSKAEATALTAGAPKNQDLLSLIEHFRDAASCHLSLQTNVPAMTTGACLQDTETEPLVRTWFYFPSISTRSKRTDLVNYAPTYALTGFLLSGKPGILCLEGTAHNVDVYMRFIKTESWSDIPAHHKKVTERFREHGVNRAFAEMQEITDTLGNRRGERANRGDMRLLEAWLVERGLDEAFIKVFM